MYNAYFGFKESPFSIAPDPRYLYMTAQHREALAHLIYGLNNDGGCILLTGEVGTGKTTICRCLLEQIPEKVNIALVLNPKISERELLATICDELQIDYPENDTSIKTFTDRINHYLIEHNAKNERTVLIIDEAQNLSSAVLEQLRLLTNLETSQRKLLQIIILGQPELLDVLARPELRQLAQRITARFHLKPLSCEEIKAYINHRLAVAGQNIQLFPDPVITQLYKLSRGIPRLINVICDRALLGCYVENRQGVEAAILKKAAKEVFGELKQQNQPAGLPLKKTLLAILLLALTAGAYLAYNQRSVLLALSGFTSHPVDTTAGRPPAEPGAGQTPAAAATAATAIINSDDETASVEAANIATPVTNENTAAASGPAGSENNGENTYENNYENSSENSGENDKRKLESFINTLPDNSKLLAYQTLFEQWHLHYRSSRTTACKQASLNGLRCRHKQGNLNSLLLHNRPAVLKLFDTQGTGRYVTLTRVEGNTATLDGGDSQIQVKTETLDKHWLGQYSLLWQPPAGYSQSVLPGHSSKLVSTLAQELATILKRPASQTPASNRYQGVLVDWVKQFQQQQHLNADGVIGPVTLIHINTALGLDVPVLKH